MTKRFWGLLVGGAFAGALALQPTVASAQLVIDATNTQVLMGVLDEMGYAPEMGVDSYGDPIITGTISNSNYALVFYDCTGKGRCGIVLFSHTWENSGSITIEQMNEWNTTKLWGQAYLDTNGDAALTIAVNLVGGLVDENFRDTVGKWAETLVDFEEFIGWTGTAPAKGSR